MCFSEESKGKGNTDESVFERWGGGRAALYDSGRDGTTLKHGALTDVCRTSRGSAELPKTH